MKGRILLLFYLTFILSCSKKETVVKPSVKAVISFTFLKADNPSMSQDAIGKISHDSIFVAAPKGTIVTSLVPTVTIKGAAIHPANKVPQDFSKPILYTVTAEDGTSRTFKVFVQVLNGLKEITSFIFKKENNPGLSEDIPGVITGDTIEVATIPGVDLSALVPTIVYTGASISPEGGYANNFYYPESYTVTADDKTSREYKVFAGSDRNLFTVGTDGYLYDFNAVTGAIRWKYFTGGSGAPVFDNGTVFVEGADHVVYAIDVASGNLKWTSVPPQGGYDMNLPVAKYGKLFFGASGWLGAPGQVAHYKGFVLCLNQQTGAQEWMSELFTGYGYSSSVITNVTVEDNIACAYDIYNGIFSFNVADGTSAWGKPGDMLGRTNPAIVGGIVYYGVEGGIRAVNASNGQQQWLLVNNLVYTSPTVGNNAIYTTSSGQLFSISTGGGINWAVSYGGPGLSAPLLYNKMIYLYGSDQKLITFSADDGSVKWTKDNFNHYPVVCNAEIFVSDANGVLNCLDAASGSQKWASSNSPIFTNPICVVDLNGVAHHIVESGGQQ